MKKRIYFNVEWLFCFDEDELIHEWRYDTKYDCTYEEYKEKCLVKNGGIIVPVINGDEIANCIHDYSKTYYIMYTGGKSAMATTDKAMFLNTIAIQVIKDGYDYTSNKYVRMNCGEWSKIYGARFM